jgi:predicted dehydrogenase
MESILNVGVIGCGYWGPNLIRNFSQLGSTNLSYICDLDEKKLAAIKSKYANVKITTNYHDLLNDPQLDIVVIALPTFKHFQIAKESLLSKKHVLLEKPMAANSKEAEELISLAKENNLVLMVDHTFEYSEAITKMKEIIDSGELGEIFYVRAEWLNLGLLQPDVNVVWDLATHVLSILNYVLGMVPESVSVNAKGYIRENIPEIADIHLNFPKRISSFVTVSWLEPKKTRRITVIGSKKLLVYDMTNEEEPIKIYDKHVDLINNFADLAQFKVNYKYGDIYSPNIKNIEALSVMCQHFVDCIKNNKKPKTSGESGLAVVKTLEAIDTSLKNNGKEVFLGHD